VEGLKIGGFWRNLGVQYKFQLLTQLALIVILVAAQFWVVQHFEEQVMKSAKVRADAIADDVVNGLNALMVAKIGKENVISDKQTRTIFLKQMSSSSGMQDVRVIRGAGIDKEFDDGLPQERPLDDLDREVLKTGQAAYRQVTGAGGGLALRSVLPYVAKTNQRGIDCLKCHDVAEGEVIGATSIVISLADDMAEIHRIDGLLWIGQAVVQLLIFLLVRFIARKAVARPLGELCDSITAIGRDKDFTRRVSACGRDEIGQTGAAFNRMLAEVQGALQGIRSSTEKLRQASENAAAAARQVVDEATQQKESGAAMASSIEELNSSMHTVAGNATEVARESSRSGEVSRQGEQIITLAANEMDGISSAVSGAALVITSLGEQSQRITTVVQTIKEIAGQTNLLALNAAVEAARAGESGRGFAVVADEVRKLAERTARSTAEIHALLSGIREGVGGAVAEVRAVVDKVRCGQASIAKVGSTIADIKEQSAKVGELVDAISSAIREESAFCRVIADNVEQVARISDAGQLTASSLFADAERLNTIANDLAGAVSAFKVA